LAIPGTFDVYLLGTGPLQFTIWLTPSVSVVTNVFGQARNEVLVSIVYGTVTIWNGTMTQAVPKLVIDHELIYGSLQISSGTTFTLTIPTQMQMGGVFLQIEILSPPNPWQKFSALIATWPLSSTSTAAVRAFLKR
jgi:hypothetical protein